MDSVVLDASAVLARTLQEPGADRVDTVIDGAWISAVNVTEVVQRLIEGEMDEMSAVALLDTLPCKIAIFDRADAYHAALLRRVPELHFEADSHPTSGKQQDRP